MELPIDRQARRPVLAAYGNWTVVREVEPKVEPTGTPQRRLLVRCSCGTEAVRYMSSLAKGASRSCQPCAARRTHAMRLSRTADKVFGHCPYWLYMHIREGALARGLPFEVERGYLTMLYRDQGARCALSGIELLIRSRTLKQSATTASLDRIDSSRGYVEGNVQWVHKQINLMKGTHSQQAFVAWCRRVAVWAEAPQSCDEAG